MSDEPGLNTLFRNRFFDIWNRSQMGHKIALMSSISAHISDDLVAYRSFSDIPSPDFEVLDVQALFDDV